MERVGLTNFVLWAIGAFVLGFFPLGGVVGAVTIGVVALGVAWWTRFWPEGLGVAAGLAGACVPAGLWTSGSNGGGTPFFVAAGVLFVATWAMWRARLAAYVAAHAGDEPGSRSSGPSRPLRLVAGVAVAAVALLPVNLALFVGFGFAKCAGDTTPEPPPGSDLANYCDFTSSGAIPVLIIFGPSLLVLGLGVLMASLRRARPVLAAALVGVVFTIAVHVPDWLVA
jgi:hypothetical protein